MLQLWLLQEAYGFDFVSKSRLGLQKSCFALHTEASETAGFHLWVSDARASETSAPSPESPSMEEGLPGPPDGSSSITCPPTLNLHP